MYENDDFLSTFFKCYHGFNPPHASKVMECIVQLGSTRKALFSNEQARTRYIDTMMQGIQNIILSSMHMSDSDCFNHFCRLLQRFRVLLATPMETHMEWLSLIAQFTQNAFESCWTPCFYLLSFWSKIVQNMQYLQQLEPEVVVKLEDITVGLARTFISNYIERVPTIIEEMLDGKKKKTNRNRIV
jgi:exportin-7